MGSGRKPKAGQYDTVSIATKVSSSNKEKLRCIAELFGMNIYQLLQTVVLLLLRSFDKQSDVSDEQEELINSYLSLIASFKNSFMPTMDNYKIKKAILFLVRAKNNTPQMLSIAVDGKGKLTKSYNLDEILVDVLNSIDSRLIDELTDEKRIRRNINLVDTLRNMILSKRPSIEQRMHEEIQDLFNDEIKDEIDEMFNGLAPQTFEELNDVCYSRSYHKQMVDGDCFVKEAAKKGWHKQVEF